MEFDAIITEALKKLGKDTVFRLANEARPNADYVFSQFLPERNETGYDVSDASMTVRSTMAGLVALDSPYPKGGAMQMSEFMAKAAKFAIEQDFTEHAQRKMQEIAAYLFVRGSSPVSVIVENILNFTDKLLVQPHLDSMEYLRAQALFTGVIDWTFGNLKLEVDYGVPSAAFLPNRTGANAYGGTTSQFWADKRAMEKYLKYNVEAYVLHANTLNAIVDNPANRIEVVAQGENYFDVRKMITSENATGQETSRYESPDARDRVRFIVNNMEAEVLDIANPGKTRNVQFVPDGKILAIGKSNNRNFVLTSGIKQGGGPDPDPNRNVALGYTHIAPTIEGNGAAGRWARIFRPESRPWGLVGQSVTNGLPVISNIDLICVASTAL